MITEQQKRLIRENPNIHSEKLANLIGCSARAVRKLRNSKWSYKGVGVPFLVFDNSFCVRYKLKYICSSPILDYAVRVVDHLIWCIENGMFNKPRIENPYFENLTFGE